MGSYVIIQFVSTNTQPIHLFQKEMVRKLCTNIQTGVWERLSDAFISTIIKVCEKLKKDTWNNYLEYVSSFMRNLLTIEIIGIKEINIFSFT